MYDRIALLKLCCPGDLLFTTPAVRAIRKSFPKSELCYVTGAYSRFVPEHNPRVSSVLTLAPPFELAGRFRGLRALYAGVRALAAEEFDLVVSFHRSPTVATMARLAGVKQILGFETAKPPATIAAPFDSNAHEVRRYLALAAAIGAAPAGDDAENSRRGPEELEYHTTPKEDEEADLLLRVLDITGPFAAIAPGGGENPGTRMPIKRWPASGFRRVVEYLRTGPGLPTIAVGSAGDAALAEAIGADRNLAGKTTFPLLAAIFKRAAVVIGNDSGPLYLAAAVGARTVGIYGPSSPDLVAPLGPDHTQAVRRVKCHPCYHPDKLTRGEIACPVGTWACMLTLGADDVIRAIKKLPAPPAKTAAGGVA